MRYLSSIAASPYIIVLHGGTRKPFGLLTRHEIAELRDRPIADQPLSRDHLELLVKDMDGHAATTVIELGADTTSMGRNARHRAPVIVTRIERVAPIPEMGPRSTAGFPLSRRGHLPEREVTMAARQRLMVGPAKGGEGWMLSLGRGQESRFGTKHAAVQAGASQGRANGRAQLVIKGGDGRIQDERTATIRGGQGLNDRRNEPR